jgi:hypothetical protein
MQFLVDLPALPKSTRLERLDWPERLQRLEERPFDDSHAWSSLLAG